VAFFIAPRINAVGRMEDMTAGIQLLLTDSPYHARLLADRIESINNERKDLQATMLDQAEDIVSRFNKIEQVGVVVYDPTWHAGIVGLVASRLKESLYRPVIAFAPAEQGSTELRGSGRSIPGFHLRDALALINTQHPGMIAKFGGHAMAAGLTIDLSQLEAFSRAFNALALRAISQEQLDAILPTDGPLAPSELSLAFAERLAEEGPWGQGFPEPVFDNVFYIWEARVLKEAHVKLSLVDDRDGEFYDAIWFNGFQGQTPSGYVRIAYTLEVNRYKKNESVNLIVRYLEPAERPVDACPIQAPVAVVEVVADSPCLLLATGRGGGRQLCRW
jgi:single-stranded-DNA-specific exonuclease